MSYFEEKNEGEFCLIFIEVKVKVKQFLYRPGVTQRVPGS
jgi:hypothetical protein